MLHSVSRLNRNRLATLKRPFHCGLTVMGSICMGDHTSRMVYQLPSFSRCGPTMPSGALGPSVSMLSPLSVRITPSSAHAQMKPPAKSGLRDHCAQYSSSDAPPPLSYWLCRNSVGMNTSVPLCSRPAPVW